jgi:hypothetical protein
MVALEGIDDLLERVVVTQEPRRPERLHDLEAVHEQATFGRGLWPGERGAMRRATPALSPKAAVACSAPSLPERSSSRSCAPSGERASASTAGAPSLQRASESLRSRRSVGLFASTPMASSPTA